MTGQTAKCHCELAGEGIKYSWACAKNFYSRVSLKRKGGQENFRSVVKESMLTDKQSVNNKRVKTFLRRARQAIYMCTFQDLERS